ncbi:MAG: hypothetical protein ACOYN3_00635 [Acidimicrobiia bacterium]
MTGFGTHPPGNDGVTQSRRMWLQRWVQLGEITFSQADAIERFEMANAGTVMPGEVGSGYQALLGWVQRWQANNLIAGTQASRLFSDLQQVQGGAPPAPSGRVAPAHTATVSAPAPASPRGSNLAVIVELLGYVGAVFVIGAAYWLMRNVWSSIDGVVQVVIIGAIAALLTAGFFAIRVGEMPAFVRLRAVVGLAATATAGAVGAVIASQLLDSRFVATWVLLISVFVCVHATLLWQGRNRPLQQIPALAGAIGATWSGMYLLETMYGPSSVRALSDYESVSDYTYWRGLTGVALVLLALLMVAVSRARSTRISEINFGFGIGTLLLSTYSLFLGFRTAGIMGTLVIAGVLLLASGLKRPAWTDAERVMLIVGGGLTLLAVPVYYVQLWVADIHVSATLVGVTAVAIGALAIVLSSTGAMAKPELADAAGSFLIVAGLSFVGADYDWLAPLAGIAVAAVFLLVGYRFDRVVLQVFGWIALVIFGIWEFVWVGQTVDLTAVIVLIIGTLLVGAAVFLNRWIQRGKRHAPESAQESIPGFQSDSSAPFQN